MKSALKLIIKYYNQSDDERFVIINQYEVNHYLLKTVKRTMILIHEFGCLFGHEKLKLISKEKIFSSAIATCIFFENYRYA